MASLGSDVFNGVDNLLLEMYNKEVLKHLKSKMDPNMLRTLEKLKDGGVGTSDIGVTKSRVESLLASIVAGEAVENCEVSDVFLSELNSHLNSHFGHVLNNEVISGIVGLVGLSCSEMPRMQDQRVKLLVDLLSFLVDSQCIKSEGSKVITPHTKRTDDIVKSPAPPAKRAAKKPTPIIKTHTIDARVLFPEVQEVYIIDSPSKTVSVVRKKTENDGDVIITKEVSLKDKLNTMCNHSDTLYNKNNVGGSKTAEETVKNEQSPTPSFVNEETRPADASYVSILESAKFPLSPREKLAYNAVCSLANTKHARCTVVDIGGCILRYFSLGESMEKKAVPSAESSRSVRGLGKGVQRQALPAHCAMCGGWCSNPGPSGLPVTGGKTLPLAPGPAFSW